MIMVRKTNTLLSAMLILSMVAPTVYAEETSITEDLTTKAEQILSTTSVTTDEDAVSAGTEANPEIIRSTEGITTTDVGSTGTDTTSEATSSDKETVKEPVKEVEEVKETPKSTGISSSIKDGDVIKTTGGYDAKLYDANDAYVNSMDYKVDKATGVYKDGIHLELRYVNTTGSSTHIPTFTVQVLDSNGKVVGKVTANKSNYVVSENLYRLVVPTSIGYKHGDEIGIHIGGMDASMKTVNFSKDLPVAEDVENGSTFVTETVSLKNDNYYYYRMGYDLMSDDGDTLERHYNFTALTPLTGWIETSNKYIAMSFVLPDGSKVKNTELTLVQPSVNKKIKLKTDSDGIAYVSTKNLELVAMGIESSQYELANDISSFGVSLSDFDGDRTLVKEVKLSLKTANKDSDASTGVAKISIKADGDTTLTNQWLETDLVFTSKGKTYNLTVGEDNLKEGATLNLPNGTYDVKATSKYGKPTLSSSTITVKNGEVKLGITVAPKYTLHISKEGSDYTYSVLGMNTLTGKEFKGKAEHVYGVVPNQSFMIEDKADGKIYTAFINPNYLTTKLVLGVGVVWGGEVSTPHTGDNIIFLVALFLISLIVAGAGFYFHKTGRRVKNVAVTSGLIAVLIISSLPLNVAQAWTGGTAPGTGAPSTGIGSTSNAIQVHSNRSLFMTTLVPAGGYDFDKANKGDLSNAYLDSLFSPSNLNTALFWASNGTQFTNAQQASFMLYDYERGALLPIWGDQSNATVFPSTAGATVTQSNRNKHGIEGSFAQRLKNLNDSSNPSMEKGMAGVMANLGTLGATRQLWNGKGAFSEVSSSTKAVGSTFSKSSMTTFFNERKTALYPEVQGNKAEFDTIADTYLGSLKGVISAPSIDKVKDSYTVPMSKLKYAHLPAELKEHYNDITSNREYVNMALIGQTVQAVYTKNVNSSTQAKMTYMPVVEIAEWFDHKLKTVQTKYKKLNYSRYDTARMAALDSNSYGSTDATVRAQAPVSTFIGNSGNTTVRALQPNLTGMPARTSNSSSALSANPFGGWGILGYGVGTGMNDSPQGVQPKLYSFIQFNVVDPVTGEKLDTIIKPWNVVTDNLTGKVTNIYDLSKVKLADGLKAFYKFDNDYTIDGYTYSAAQVPDDKGNLKYPFKYTLTDRATDTSLSNRLAPINLEATKLADSLVKPLNRSITDITSILDTLIKQEQDGYFGDSEITLALLLEFINHLESIDPSKPIDAKYNPVISALELYDGNFYLGRKGLAVPYRTLSSDTGSITLDGLTGNMPSLLTIKNALSPSKKFIGMMKEADIYYKETGNIAPAKVVLDDTSEDLLYPGDDYSPQMGAEEGIHYSSANLVLEVTVTKLCENGSHNLKTCEITPHPAVGSHHVPQWMLSRYFPDSTPNDQSDTIVHLNKPGSTWRSPSITPGGLTQFNLKPAKAVSDEILAIKWLETKSKWFMGDTGKRSITPQNQTFTFHNGGDLLAIKDNTQVTNSKLASWKNGYAILGGKIQPTVKGEVEPNGKASITKKETLIHPVRSPYDNHTYSETRTACGIYSCWDYTWYGASSYAYPYDSTNHITVTFDRYNPKDGVAIPDVAKKTETDNGFYWESYQDTQAIEVDPEVAMTYEDNQGTTTVVQSAGDKLRKIKPLHYNSIRYKDVKVIPKVDGMSVATDVDAKTLASKLNASKLDVVYKGASTSNSFEVTGEIELRTYALDIGNTALKNAWGNGSYSTEKVRDEFLTRHATKQADGTWNIKPSAKGNFVINAKDLGGVTELKNVTQKNYKVLEHTLVVRGGKVLTVNGKTDFSQLDPLLKDAIARMNITTEVGKNVFLQFERSKGSNLTTDKEAKLINAIRGTQDMAVGKPWYYEDTTSLVVREYITTYDIPSHVYVDKVPQELAGLQTPMDKNQFFKQGQVGFGKYTVKLVDSYMMYDSSNATPFGGQFERLFVAPNVSVTDTAQFQ